MNIIFREQFKKDLLQVKDKKLKERLSLAIDNIDKASKISDISGLKKLAGFKIHYRIRMGDYRLGLVIEKGEVEFVHFLHRKDIYKKFP